MLAFAPSAHTRLSPQSCSLLVSPRWNPFQQYRGSRHRACQGPRCSGGRGPEFSISGSPSPFGVDWERWRSIPGDKTKFPILPFSAEEVMMPGEEKTLHLFEARYLALFDDVMTSYDQCFAHVLISHKRASLAASGTLVHIAEWERMEVGVKIRIHGIGRINVASISDREQPYFTGYVAYMDDEIEEDCESQTQSLERLISVEREFWEVASRIITVSIALGMPPFRVKTYPEPAELLSEGNEVAACSPPDDISVDTDHAGYMEQLQHAILRAMWPLGIQSQEEPANTNLRYTENEMLSNTDMNLDILQNRLRSISFVGFDLFDSDIEQRQRAIELRCITERLRRVMQSCTDRLKLLDARLALRKAFSSTTE